MDVVNEQIVYKINKQAKNAVVFRIQAKNKNTDITIPFEVDGYPVVEIVIGAFKDAKFLKKITLPHTIKRIQNRAFSECVNLETVIHRGNGVLEIGYEAFDNCLNLSYFSSLGIVKLTASNAFANCVNLKTLDCIFCGEIPDNTFRYCEQLEELSFGFSPTKIHSNAFVGCKNLKRIISRGNLEFSNTAGKKLQKYEIHCYEDSQLLDLAYDGQKIVIIEDTLPF